MSSIELEKARCLEGLYLIGVSLVWLSLDNRFITVSDFKSFATLSCGSYWSVRLLTTNIRAFPWVSAAGRSEYIHCL